MSLVDPKIREGYERQATTNGWEEKKTTWFDFRWGMDGTKGKAGEHIISVKAKDTGQSSVHRAHFLDELVKLVPESCATFGKKVLQVEDLGREGVRLAFEDGTEAEASAVVGCDGIQSHVRPILLGLRSKTAHASFTGKYAYRGLIPMEKAVGLLGDELARNAQMYLGYHGHILTFPIEKGEVMNVVAFRTKSDGKWEDEKWVLPMRKEDMEGDFKEWGESVKKILRLMEKPDLWALFDHDPADTYCKGRVCLTGDSAHASTPHQGAGAGMAMEDAYVMSNLLGEIKGPEGIEGAFKAFDKVRRPRTQKLVTTSRDAGELYEMERGDDVERVKEDLAGRYEWIWGVELEDELERAREILGGREGPERS